MRMFNLASAVMNCFATLAFLCASSYAHADDWGCQVLLCLADPRGPETESACVPPIKKLWSELRKGHAFPVCTMSDGNTAGNIWASSRYCREDLLSMSGGESPQPVCNASGAIDVNIGGHLFTRVWWGVRPSASNGNAGTVTENYASGNVPQYDPTTALDRFLQRLQQQQQQGSGNGGGGGGGGE